jgi:hypothetical protein
LTGCKTGKDRRVAQGANAARRVIRSRRGIAHCCAEGRNETPEVTCPKVAVILSQPSNKYSTRRAWRLINRAPRPFG